MKKLIFLIAFTLSSTSFAVSFQEIVDSYPEVTISPVIYNSLPIKTEPATVCVIAGYQLAVAYSEAPTVTNGKYFFIGAGWANATSVSGLTLVPSMAGNGNESVRPLQSVTCRKKLALK